MLSPCQFQSSSFLINLTFFFLSLINFFLIVGFKTYNLLSVGKISLGGVKLFNFSISLDTILLIFLFFFAVKLTYLQAF